MSFSAALLDADVATIQQAILDDLVFADGVSRVYPGAFAKNGLLYVPRRGVLKVCPGDYVAVDASGWPILVSKEAIAYAASSWTHAP